MKKSRNTIYVLPIVCVLSGCTSSKEAKESATMLVGVSAMVASVPLIPVAMVYTIPEEYSDSKKRSHWKNILDPVYKERTEIIKARSAAVDAKTIFDAGYILYLPSQPESLSRHYPGLFNKQYDTSQNMTALAENELASYLWELMKADPAEKDAGTYYMTTVWSNHNRAKFSYLEKFNQTMQQMESNQRVEPTAKTPIESGKVQGADAAHP